MPYEALQQPLSLPGLHLRNRVVMSSLTRNRAMPHNYANDANKEYYRQRAASQVGLLLSEGVLVSAQGSEWPHVADLYSEAHAEAWSSVVKAVHDEGAQIVAQLWHVGRTAHPDMPLAGGKPVSAPSPVAAKGGKFRLLNDSPYVAPSRAHPNPLALVDEFRQSARYAKQAGFDAVELHGANGYLLHQFLDKNSNTRDDIWGGSVENRARIYVECFKAVFETYEPAKVGIKLNPCAGYNDVGMNEQDTIESFNYVINKCVEFGIGYVQLVRYVPWMDGEGRSETHLDVLEHFGPLVKNSTSKTALFLNGNIQPDEGEQLVKDGKVDAIVFGRPWISNPDYAKRIFAGQKTNEELEIPGIDKSMYTWFAAPGDDPNVGYTDYPTYEEATKSG